MRSLPFGHCCASAGAASATVSAAMPATAIHFHTRIVDLLLLDVGHDWGFVSRVRTTRLALGPGFLAGLCVDRSVPGQHRFGNRMGRYATMAVPRVSRRPGVVSPPGVA